MTEREMELAAMTSEQNKKREALSSEVVNTLQQKMGKVSYFMINCYLSLFRPC